MPKTFEEIKREINERRAARLKKCLESPNPICTAVEEVIRRWDDLGTYKDDNNGEVQEAMEMLRKVMVIISERAKEDGK